MKHTVWPAYLLAVVCFVVAIGTSIANIALIGQLKQAQTEAANFSQRAKALAANLVQDRAALSDTLDSRTRHHSVSNGDVLTRGSHLYLALRDVPEPPRGKVYQAWTMAKGSQRMTAAETFIPNVNGIAFVALSADARATVEVAVTVEPDGGSKEPTSKPIVGVPVDSQ